MINAVENSFVLSYSDLIGYLSPHFYQSIPEPLDHNVKLRELVRINPTRKKPVFEPDELVPYVGLPETSEHSNSIVEVVMRPYKEVAGRNVIYPHDLLFARIEPSVFNKKYILANDLKGFDFAFTSTEFYILEARENVSIQYVFITLLTDYVFNQIKGRTTGSTGRRRLDSDIFSKIEIPYPDKDIVQKAVDLFVLAKQQKHQKEAEAQKLLDSIDDYLLGELGITLPQKDNSLASRMFTTSIKKVSGNRFDPFYNDTYYTDVDKIIGSSKYSTSKLRRLVNSISGVVYSRDDQINTTNGKVILRANNIDLISNQLIFDDLRFINPDLEISETLKLYEGDILMSSASGSKEHVGKVAYIDNDLDYYFGGFMSVLRQRSNDILPKYLFLILRSRLYRTMLMRILGGTNINNLGFKMIAGLEIPVPTKPIQEKLSHTGFNKIEEYKKLMTDANSDLLNAQKQIEQMILKN